MALTGKTLLLYGFQVTPLNSSLDFRTVSGGPVLQATLTLGFYSLSGLLNEITAAMKRVDSTWVYASSVDRTIAGGTQNRVTIRNQSGSFFQLLFGTGPRRASSCAGLIGFSAVDYVSNTQYTGSTSAGIPIVTELVAYNYLSPEMNRKVYGAVNVSANGTKESVTFQIQRFIELEMKYELKANVVGPWLNFIDWAIQQRDFEITPDLNFPTVVSDVNLEKTEADGKGLAWKWRELLPQFPNTYSSGKITLRVQPATAAFL